jgi:hypothetical protein
MATAVLQKSYPRSFTPGNILECELYFESESQEKSFKKKLSNLIKKHMEIRIPEDRMRACKKLMEIVEMLATAETELPFKPEDQVVINTYGCRKGSEWFVDAMGQWVMSLPSDYWLVRNKRYDKQLESKI